MLNLLYRSLVLLMCLHGAALAGNNPPVVANLDLEKFLGTWNEFARLSTFFERNLEQISSTYFYDEQGRLRVRNIGHNVKSTAMDSVVGFLRFAGNAHNGEMELSFFRPFWASYRIIEVVGDYQVIVTMGSDLTSLWILGRSRHLDRNTFVAIKKDLDEKGFDTSKLIVAPGVDQ